MRSATHAQRGARSAAARAALAAALAAATLAGLTACGGGGDDPPPSTPPAATDQVPASALASVSALIDFVAQLARSGASQPLALPPALTLPSSDSAAAADIN